MERPDASMSRVRDKVLLSIHPSDHHRTITISRGVHQSRLIVTVVTSLIDN